MNLEQAKLQIKLNITKGTDINTIESKNRIILSYHDDIYKVKIDSKNTTIKVSMEMLQKCYQPISDGKSYNRAYFKKLYPNKLKNHDYYVHVIGQIFVKANIAIQIDKHNYSKM